MRRIVLAVLAASSALVAGAVPAQAQAGPVRTEGYPTSGNGASSMHLGWETRTASPTEVTAVLEIIEPPTASDLYFWALQADFVDGASVVGGAHLGLQWDPTRPGRTAVNFGGYAGDREMGGTTDFRWQPGHRYELRIVGDGDGWWRGEVTDLGTGRTRLAGRLHVGGTALTRPFVWSEVFARCDAPGTAVRWSQLDPSPSGLLVTYQSYRRGGCTNTTAEATAHGVVQRTNARRTVGGYEVLRARW